jgi:hypothetical protein
VQGAIPRIVNVDHEDPFIIPCCGLKLKIFYTLF